VLGSVYIYIYIYIYVYIIYGIRVWSAPEVAPEALGELLGVEAPVRLRVGARE